MTSIFSVSCMILPTRRAHHSLQYLRRRDEPFDLACILPQSRQRDADTLVFLTQVVPLLLQRRCSSLSFQRRAMTIRKISALRKRMLKRGRTRVMLGHCHSDAEAFIRERLPNANTVDLIAALNQSGVSRKRCPS